jgi:hypothetical protein
VEVDLPHKVTLAGPVAFTAATRNATSARARLDGVDLGALQDTGDGPYAGTLSIHGSVDNGDHVLEVIAERDELSDHRDVPFVVAAPASGKLAWATAGPAGSRTTRNALTPGRDVIEVGTLVVDGVQQPMIRKLSGLNGAELWREGTIVLDDSEGWAVDVAVTPEGQLWAAMNVRTAANVWRPRIVLLDAMGQFTGVEVVGEAGQTVSAIDNDGSGGYVAVGFAGSGQGDTDVIVWRMNGDHVPLLGGVPWDYQPKVLPHEFSDIATDVVVQDHVAWIVGMTIGQHDKLNVDLSRGFILRLGIDSADVIAPVIIMPSSDEWPQSKLFGAAAHPDGILATGNACDKTCATQRVETALFTAAGTRSWFRPESSAPAAQGNAVALDSHGRVTIAATVQDGAALRGYLLGRVVHDETAEPFSAGFPVSKEDSGASAVAIDEFDVILGGGYRTLGGVTEARTLRLHP